MKRSLSWSLVVATYNRASILPACIKLAVEQTYQPSEIIIVDASNDWEVTRDRILAELAGDYPNIRWVYVAAEQRSLTCQRNQGIRLATADILFLFDDDTMMYPTCAEEILRVYEADSQNFVRGVQAAIANSPPTDFATTASRKETSESSKQISRFGAIGSFLWKYVLLMNTEQLWIPYNRTFPNPKIPPAVEQLNIQPVKLFQGWRMTYRRDAIAAEPFESLLYYYAAAEDLDASYRVSRQGALVEALDAKAHHFDCGSGRLSRLQVAALSVLNQALFLRKNSDDLGRDRTRFYWLTVRRLMAEFLKDMLSRRWSLPQVRGLLLALRYSPPIFSMRLEDLSEWYPILQKKLVEQAS